MLECKKKKEWKGGAKKLNEIEEKKKRACYFNELRINEIS